MIYSGCCICGAAVGTGIFMSVILNSTPLSVQERKLSNLIVADSLKTIALSGGPRCCKRDCFIALETAISFVYEHLNIKLGSSDIKCIFLNNNNECLHENCRYYSS